LFDTRHEAAVRDEQRQRRVLENSEQLFAPEARVQNHCHHAGFLEREIAERKRDRVREKNSHPVAGFDLCALKVPRHARGPLIEQRERQRFFARDERDLVGVSPGAKLQEFSGKKSYSMGIACHSAKALWKGLNQWDSFHSSPRTSLSFPCCVAWKASRRFWKIARHHSSLPEMTNSPFPCSEKPVIRPSTNSMVQRVPSSSRAIVR